MRLRYAVAIALLGGSSAAQSPEVEVPEEVAYSTLFHILRTAPKPHWDSDVAGNWLAKYGLTEKDVRVLWTSANRYLLRLQPLDEKLTRHHEAAGHRITSPEALAGEAAIRHERAEALWVTVGEALVQLPPEARVKLDLAIQGIRKDTRRAEFPSPGTAHHLGAPHSLAFVYTAVAETGEGEVSATTVATTGGASGHKVAAAVRVQRPDGFGRAAAAERFQYTSVVTSYVEMCLGDSCLDGVYPAGADGTRELCASMSGPFLLPVASPLRRTID
jgi:hypothetical protein